MGVGNLSDTEVLNRHGRRKWPQRGKAVSERRLRLEAQIENDLQELFQRRFSPRSMEKTLWQMLKFARRNYRSEVRQLTVRLALQQLRAWLERSAESIPATERWCQRVLESPYDSLAAGFARGLAVIGKEAAPRRQQRLFEEPELPSGSDYYLRH